MKERYVVYVDRAAREIEEAVVHLQTAWFIAQERGDLEEETRFDKTSGDAGLVLDSLRDMLKSVKAGSR